MRDLDFRAWSFDKKLIYERVLAGNTLTNDPCSSVWIPGKKMWVNFTNTCGVVMQFTGLLDKNGEKVFEGDLIRNEVGNIFQIYYDQYLCMFRQRFLKNRELSFEINPVVCSEWEEVIGNIYEHPHLLEQKQ